MSSKNTFPLVSREYVDGISEMNDRLRASIEETSAGEVREARLRAADELCTRSFTNSTKIHSGISEAQHKERLQMVLDCFGKRAKQILSLNTVEELAALTASFYRLPMGEFFDIEYPYHSDKEEYIRWAFNRYPKSLRGGRGQQRFEEICKRIGKPATLLAWHGRPTIYSAPSGLSTVFSLPVQEDRDSFDESGIDSSTLDGRIKATVTNADGNSAILFIDYPTFLKLGNEYIAENVSMRYSTALEEWQANLSQNAYYNNLERFPEKVVKLRFVGIRPMDGAEAYKSVNTDGRPSEFFFRQVSAREPFAKWFSSAQNLHYDVGSELRPNIVLELEGQTERVRYDDWNGVCAYSDTFNPNFRRSLLRKGDKNGVE